MKHYRVKKYYDDLDKKIAELEDKAKKELHKKYARESQKKARRDSTMNKVLDAVDSLSDEDSITDGEFAGPVVKVKRKKATKKRFAKDKKRNTKVPVKQKNKKVSSVDASEPEDDFSVHSENKSNSDFGDSSVDKSSHSVKVVHDDEGTKGTRRHPVRNKKKRNEL